MSKSCSISLIVPVYNVEKYLARCLESLLNQTYKDIEIICINDGSTDSSYEILKEYSAKDARIVILNQSNQGISIARNNGLKIATGEYIGYVDSDDWLELDFCEKLYNAVKKYDADVAVGGIVKTSDKYQNQLLSFQEEKVYDSIHDKFIVCDVPDKSYVWNKIYRKSKLVEHDINFIPNVIYEDIVFTPKVLYYTDKLVTVPDTNYYYFRHHKTLVRIKNKKAKSDFMYSKKIIKAFLAEHGIDIEQYSTKTKKYRILGLTLYKVKKKNGKTEHILMNCIKW